MEKLNFIFKRRSIRKYTSQPIDDETIELLLKAAMAAPSACAKDPWRFIIIRSDDLKQNVVDALPNGKMMADAPVGIVVLGDINEAHGNELSYMLQDCSAAIQNLLLAASELGLGTVWLGVHPREERINHIKKVFNLPDNIIPISCIAVGYPAERKDARTRYNPSYVGFEKF